MLIHFKSFEFVNDVTRMPIPISSSRGLHNRAFRRISSDLISTLTNLRETLETGLGVLRSYISNGNLGFGFGTLRVRNKISFGPLEVQRL